LKLRDIATGINGDYRGDGDTEIYGVSSVTAAGPGQLTFVAKNRFRRLLSNCNASAVILRKDNLSDWSGSAIICEDPYVGYARAAQLLAPTSALEPGIHDTATISSSAEVNSLASIGVNCVIEPGVKIDEGVVVGHGCIVSEGVSIGAMTTLHSNVTIYHDVAIGKRCIIHSGAVLGSDGFGNAKDIDRWVRIPQVGSLRIGDDVQIGANSTIDRGTLEDTTIGNDVVIDNQVHIGHNCNIGDHVGIAGCVGIAGSVEIGQRCTLAGGVGLVDNIQLGDDVHITAMSLVSASITTPGTYSSGTAHMPHGQWKRSAIRFRQLDESIKRLSNVERKLGK